MVFIYSKRTFTTTPYGFMPGQNCFQSLELIFIVNLTSSRPTICSQLYLACVAWLFPEIIHSPATQIKLLGLLPVLELDQTLSCFGNCSKLTQKMAKSCWLLRSSIVTIDMFWAFLGALQRTFSSWFCRCLNQKNQKTACASWTFNSIDFISTVVRWFGGKV